MKELIDRELKELQQKIIHILKENNGEIEVEEICTLLGISSYEIPWGYKIGWSKCIQPNQKYHLILSGEDE